MTLSKLVPRARAVFSPWQGCAGLLDRQPVPAEIQKFMFSTDVASGLNRNSFGATAGESA